MDIDEQIKAAEANGREYAVRAIAAGERMPQESPLSGEYAGTIHPREVVNMAAGEDVFDHAQDWEVDAVVSAWEEGYESAPWPGLPGGYSMGDQVELMRYGKWEGPFTVTDRTGRSREHLVLLNPKNGVLFEEHYDEYNVRRAS